MNHLMKQIIIETMSLLREEEGYSKEEIEKARIAIGLLIDSTLTKPTLDVNTFIDPNDKMMRDSYEWFRDNPSEYIEAYSDLEDGETDNAAASYGPVRDPKETTLLYYLYRGVYFKDGKWNIGKGENIDKVIREIRARASAFVDAISESQLLIDVFFADWKKSKDEINKYIDKVSTPTQISHYMSKGSPGSFKRLEFGKFRKGAMYSDTTTRGIIGTRDHMYKGTKEFENIPDEHKQYFLFDYIWQTCYNYAQADGLKPTDKKVEPLTDKDFSLNYQNGLTDEEDKKMFGKGWIPDQMRKSPEFKKSLGFIISPLNKALLNRDRKIDPFTKPVSQMSNMELINELEPEFTDLLKTTKEALTMNIYPSLFIDLLRIKELIPNELIEQKKAMYSRIIKGMQIVGYLDENENFTDMVEDKDYKPKQTVYDNLADFESAVTMIAREQSQGRVSTFAKDKLEDKFNLLKPEEMMKAKEILQKHKVDINTIRDSTIDTSSEIVNELDDLMYSILLDQTKGKNDETKRAKVVELYNKANEKEKEEIMKLLRYWKNRGVA